VPSPERTSSCPLWWLSGDDRVGQEAARRLTDDTNQVLLSVAVVWEVAIKRSLGKLDAPEDLAPTLLGAGAQPLPVTLDHVTAVETLPRRHRDPFDRLLIAQALTERAALVSADERLRGYGVSVVW
jgi:PIN domain nuclease of toxin-antitoxin system